MNIVEKNEEILNRWKQRFTKRGKNPELYFADDGIMFRGPINNNSCDWVHDPSGFENEMWEKCPLRILYITKDQNISNGYCWDVREEAYHSRNQESKEEYILSRAYSFHKRLVKSLYGIHCVNNKSFIAYDDIVDSEALKLVDNIIYARINCKKEGGTSQCSDPILFQAIEQDADLLKEQILNLDSDIFVCCGNHYEENLFIQPILNDICRYHFKWLGGGICYDELANKVAIDAYHLSVMGYKDAKYYNDIVLEYYNFIKTHPLFLQTHRK